MISKTFLSTVIATSFVATAIFSQLASAENEEIIERVKPVGQLVIKVEDKTEKAADVASTGTETAAPATVSAGKATYDTACFACHSTGAAGAPIVGNKDAWASRVIKDKETLYFNAINGINTMPAKGGAASLSDGDVKAVVDYMVEQSS